MHFFRKGWIEDRCERDGMDWTGNAGFHIKTAFHRMQCIFSEGSLSFSINQSSLSKHLNSLLDKEFVKKEEKEYKITRLGKTEYSNMLRLYDLDRQSILEEESKRIKEIKKSTANFFDEFKIADIDIKLRFLNNKLKLPYEKVSSSLENERDYDKVLLFLAINHPENYPDHITPEEFSEKYEINQIKLNFVILRIVEENIFPVKFFQLDAEEDKKYYFQANEKLERMLNVIVEDHITKFTYLRNLEGGETEGTSRLTLNSIVNPILDEIVFNLFDSALRSALSTFLPNYINYLAYKVERDRKLLGTFDKLEGLIWKEVMKFNFTEVEDQFYIDPAKNFEKNLEKIDTAIKKNPEQLDLYYLKSKILMYFDKYSTAIELLDGMLRDFPENEKELMMKKASILKKMRDLDGGLRIIQELTEKYPDDNDLLNYKALWYQYLNNKEKSLTIIQELIEQEPNNGIYQDSFGEILMAFREYESAIDKFQMALKLDSKSWYNYQTYIKLGICYRELEDYDLALENLRKGEELIEKSPSDKDTKQMWRSYAEPFIEEIKVLIEDF